MFEKPTPKGEAFLLHKNHKKFIIALSKIFISFVSSTKDLVLIGCFKCICSKFNKDTFGH